MSELGLIQPHEYRLLRRRYLRHEIDPDPFFEEARAVVLRTVRARALPAALSPYGNWDEEAAIELFQAWSAHRLVDRGQLRELVAKADGIGAFRGLAERSLRQFLLNQRDRSQLQNLYARLRALLEEERQFHCFVSADRSQDRWWGLSGWDDAAPYSGGDRELASAAWSVGELTIIRYRADARKLSPVLDTFELRRFTTLVLEALGATLTPVLILRALQQRLDLNDAPTLEIDTEREPAHLSDPADGLALRESAQFAIDELTERQERILIATSEGVSVSVIADTIGCSTGTVTNERHRVGDVLHRLSATDDEQRELLKTVLDLLYQAGRHGPHD
jgi:DNA-binding CsgD family transcriptional regulator